MTMPDASQPAYATTSGPHKIHRVKLGLLFASLAACLSVSLLGLVGMFLLTISFKLFPAIDARMIYGGDSFLQGLQLGVMMSLYNFILFFLTVPAAWLAMGLSIGRFPHRGIADRKPYLKWAAIWGMILVGGTTSIFGALMAGPLSGLGALLIGLLIGCGAGLFCGFLFYTIVKPASQLHMADISVF